MKTYPVYADPDFPHRRWALVEVETTIEIEGEPADSHPKRYVTIQPFNHPTLYPVKRIVPADVFKERYKCEGTCTVWDDEKVQKIVDAIVACVKEETSYERITSHSITQEGSRVTMSITGNIDLAAIARKVNSAI
jgi:hypothetical protein